LGSPKKPQFLQHFQFLGLQRRIYGFWYTWARFLDCAPTFFVMQIRVIFALPSPLWCPSLGALCSCPSRLPPRSAIEKHWEHLQRRTQKQLNRSRCRLGADLCGSKEAYKEGVKVGRICSPPPGVTIRRCGLLSKFFDHMLPSLAFYQQ